MRLAAAVLSEGDGIFILKAEQRRIVKAFLGVDDVSLHFQVALAEVS